MALKEGLRDGILDLSAVIPKLPQVRFPDGAQVQIRALTAEGYERYRQFQRLYYASLEGQDVPPHELLDLVDELLRIVLPDASPDNLASLGVRLEARMAPVFAAAGEVDATLSVLNALYGDDDEGKATAG